MNVTAVGWDLTPIEAREEQSRLACRVVARGNLRNTRWIAGLDASISADGRQAVGVVVLWDRHRREAVEEHIAWSPLRFPYIPGLLSYREAPVLLAALAQLRRPPDLLLCDGQGLAHPRRFGLACHLGVLTGLRSVGCAKSILVGDHAPLGRQKGALVPLIDRGEVVGHVLRTREGVQPVYVSVGHRVGRQAATAIALECAVRYRLPEPVRLADTLTKVARRRGPI